MTSSTLSQHNLQQSSIWRYVWLSTAAAVLTIVLKFIAYKITSSVGLLSDALESGVNLITAAGLWLSLAIAMRPPDEKHMFGHSKAEYFSGALTGLVVLGAAVMVVYSAVGRWLTPEPLQQLGVGVAVSALAAGINLAVSRVLVQAGKRHQAVSLTAEGKHLLTDVWTTAGVALGVALVWLTGWLWVDILIAVLVGGQIAWTGFGILREALHGLMDTALPAAEVEEITAVLDQYRLVGVDYHALRTRQAGAKRFVSLHLQVPGRWSVQRGHDIADEIEVRLHHHLDNLSVLTHLEPLEDPLSWEDVELWRELQPVENH